MKTDISKDYNCVLSVVDIAVIDFNKKRLLLGRKPNEVKYRFIGGFTDLHQDRSYEDAARRELQEEAPNIEASLLKYIGSSIIDDPRYRNDRNKLFTSFFYCEYVFGQTKAGDDLAELQWFDIDKIKYADIVEEHKILLDMFLVTWMNLDRTVYES
jgi:bifunctional NMN adenylyltransferase/nudix hydrolase